MMISTQFETPSGAFTIKIHLLAMIAAIIMSGCARESNKPRKRTAPPVSRPTAAVSIIPAELAGLRLDPADKPRNYNDKNLWEYIDGGAREIIRLGFRELTVAYYKQPGSSQEVRVEIFTMRSSAASQALFNAWRAKNTDDNGICGRSVYDAPTLLWQKGAFYVQLIATDDNPGAKPLLENAGKKLCALLTTPSRPGNK